MYLHNKNILEYVEIVGTEPKSMIHDNECHSTSHVVNTNFTSNISKAASNSPASSVPLKI